VAQQFELHLAPSLVDVFISLLWSENKSRVGPMTRNTAFGAKGRLLPGEPKHKPCVMLLKRAHVIHRVRMY
jgi:hypothetical protein